MWMHIYQEKNKNPKTHATQEGKAMGVGIIFYGFLELNNQFLPRQICFRIPSNGRRVLQIFYFQKNITYLASIFSELGKLEKF